MFSRTLMQIGAKRGHRLLQQALFSGELTQQAGVASPYTMNTSRHSYHTPRNTVVMFVPQQEAWVVERMGKFFRILEPGLNILIPIIDKVKYVQCLKELTIEIPQQSAITADNVMLNIDGVLYLKVTDPYLASYGVEDPEFAVMQLAQTTMRSEIGKMQLDSVFRERESLNACIVESINKASGAWGITCLRYEIRDIKLPNRVHEAMQMQVEAERKKRAAILESEGKRDSEVNIAEGKRLARILTSEALKQEEINKAAGMAAAIISLADARAKGLNTVSSMLRQDKAKDAAALVVAEQYVEAFSKLAKTNNTMILPSNMTDMSSFMGQAFSMYKHLNTNTVQLKPISDKELEETVAISQGRPDAFAEAYNKLENAKQAENQPHSGKDQAALGS